VATLIDGVGANDRSGRAGAIHREFVGNRVGVVAVEAEQVELLRRFGLVRRFGGKAGVPLLLYAPVVVGAAVLVGFAEPIIGRANQPGPVVGASLRAVGIIAVAKRGRRQEPRTKIGVLVILQLFRPDRGHSRD